jgi:hypothetical protein
VDNNDEPVPDISHADQPAWIQFGETGTHTSDVNSSWYITNDYLSLVSSMFMYYRGSIGLKIVSAPATSQADLPFKYVALRHVSDKYPAHNPFTSLPTVVPPEANFGVGTVITPGDKQPVFDFTVPFIAITEWRHTTPNVSTFLLDTMPGTDVLPRLTSNVTLLNEDGDLTDTLFRKAGADYQLWCATTLPPPTLWRVSGGDWS